MGVTLPEVIALSLLAFWIWRLEVKERKRNKKQAKVVDMEDYEREMYHEDIL